MESERCTALNLTDPHNTVMKAWVFMRDSREKHLSPAWWAGRSTENAGGPFTLLSGPGPGPRPGPVWSLLRSKCSLGSRASRFHEPQLCLAPQPQDSISAGVVRHISSLWGWSPLPFLPFYSCVNELWRTNDILVLTQQSSYVYGTNRAQSELSS